MPARDAARVASELDRLALLRYVEPERTRGTLGWPSLAPDPLARQEWHLERVDAAEVEPPGPGVPITMIDTGVDVAHEEFAGRPETTLLDQQDVSAADPVNDHGTATASTAGAPVNGKGLVGVYPRARLRVYDLPGLTDGTLVAALDAATAAGPGVINLSLGGPGFSRALHEATLRAFAGGSLIVAAAGNEFLDGNPIIYPANYPHVLTVAATDKRDDHSVFSSSSTAVDLAAPGEAIPVAVPRAFEPSGYAVFDGTSFSSPIVAAAAAWVWTVRGPSLDRTQVFDLMRYSARDIAAKGFDERTGFGLLDLGTALVRPIPALDPFEPNDDVDQVRAGGVFAEAKPVLVGRRIQATRVLARLDIDEDPDDVYRVVVPAGRTLDVTVRSPGDVGVIVWRLGTRSVYETGPAAARDQLAGSDRPGPGRERVRWTNRARRDVTVLLNVWIPQRADDLNPPYVLRASVR
ncbi:MAG: S8 family serine peptidase [Thermoleophilia bacterium]